MSLEVTFLPCLRTHAYLMQHNAEQNANVLTAIIHLSCILPSLKASVLRLSVLRLRSAASWSLNGTKLYAHMVHLVQVEGGRTMKLRVNDPAYLGHVDRFWNVLLPKMAPYLYHRGGPILMTQACCTLLTDMID